MNIQKKRRPPRLSLETIAATLAPFGIGLSQAQLISIKDYVELLLLWNQSIKLTAIEDPVEIVSRHFGESLFAATFLSLSGGRLPAVGTWARFSGLPPENALRS